MRSMVEGALGRLREGAAGSPAALPDLLAVVATTLEGATLSLASNSELLLTLKDFKVRKPRILF